jgi:universal stress protein A
MQIKRILVPVDYSPCSQSALAFASMLATRFGSVLDIVHVWDRPSYVTEVVLRRSEPVSGHSLIALVEANAERDLAEFLANAKLPDGIRPGGRLLSGDPTSAILADLKANPPDLLVVGTHGRTGLTHALMGSVAEKLVRLAAVPVVTVPQAAAE